MILDGTYGISVGNREAVVTRDEIVAVRLDAKGFIGLLEAKLNNNIQETSNANR